MSDHLITLIVCGAPLAARTPDLASALLEQGWKVSVVGTPAAEAWLDAEAITRLIGEPPRLHFRSPGQAKRAGSPAAVAVCPATFNTVNKAATGVNDNYAVGVLCEALGTGLPVLLVPMVNNKLWGHPVWAANLETMKGAGASLIDVVSGGTVPTPVPSGTGDRVVAGFDPRWLTAPLARLVTG